MQVKIPAVIMRGGTSKGVFFKEGDLPADPEIRDRVILVAFGSPDPYARQIDGLGGATSTTSKACIIGPPTVPGTDVNYLFGQVSITTPLIDYSGNCGNLSGAVGPFAIEEGMVKATRRMTEVRIWQVNTKKLIVAHVPTENGLPSVEGDYAIDGIPGTGARIRLDYYDPGGALTGRLLPTGRVRDTVHVDGVGPVEISLVDASNIGCFFHPRALGLTGTELPEQVDADPVLLARIESIRAQAAVLCGLAATAEEATLRSPANPKIAFVSPPTDYTTIKGSRVRAPDVDLVGRIMSMGKAHRAYALTGAIATSVAAAIEGTVANEVCRPGPAEREVRVGHPSGVIAIGAHVERRADGWHAVKVSNSRTARRLMEGHVYVPARILAAAAR